MWRRRSWFSLKGKAGIPGQTEGCPATSIGPRVLPVGSLQQRGARAQSAPQTPAGSATPTEGQKREFNRSYVQAATDCIARAIAADNVAMGHALGERWSEAVVATGATCREPLARMTAQHDRLYGEGTGDAFLKDSYFSDLPRALMLRLTPE